MSPSVNPDEPPQRWIDTGGFGVSGTVKFSPLYGCWTYYCQWGCFGFDFESEYEAMGELSSHDCDRSL